MTWPLITGRPPADLPPGHCDMCGGDGFCELAPLRPGSGKMACPACRATFARVMAAVEAKRRAEA